MERAEREREDDERIAQQLSTTVSIVGEITPIWNTVLIDDTRIHYTLINC